MAMTIISIANAVWVNPEMTMIDCNITTAEFGAIPYTAMLGDSDVDAAALYTDLVNGVYGVIQGYVPPVDPILTLEDYKVDLAAKRYEKETQGVTVDGVEIQTDRESRASMAEKVIESVINGLVNVNWKKANGTFTVYTSQDFKDVFKAIVGYTEHCYQNERILTEALDAASDPSTVDLDAGWANTVLTTS